MRADEDCSSRPSTGRSLLRVKQIINDKWPGMPVERRPLDLRPLDRAEAVSLCNDGSSGTGAVGADPPRHRWLIGMNNHG
ncbi:MAG: hypothetical protein R3C02_25820 [Planctomycetaceae bacterium]